MYKQILIHDISFWQDRNDTPQKVDFAKMKASGAQGVILRVGQGNSVDEDFKDYYATAKGILPRGLYWFYDSRVPPLVQATKFAALVPSGDVPEMEIWADFEETYGGPYAGWRNFAVFLAKLESLLSDAKIGIYTGYYYWQSHSPSWFQSASFNWFAKFPLWLAWYTTNDSLVKIPAPWKSALYWQFSSHGDGLAAGVESLNIDCNYFQGSQAEFNTRYSTTYVPPVVVPPVGPPVEMRNATVIITAITVRKNIWGEVVHPSVKRGDKIQVLSVLPDELGNEWAKIGTDRWICVKWQGVSWIHYDDEIVFPPVASPAIGTYRVKHDFEKPTKVPRSSGWIPGKKLRGLPETCRLNGGRGNVLLPSIWDKYVQFINKGNPNAYRYVTKEASGWCNHKPKFEELTFGGNLVEVTKIVGTRAYVKTYFVNQTPPTEFGPSTLVQRFSVCYTDGSVEMATPIGNVYTLLIANPGEELWIDLSNLVKV